MSKKKVFTGNGTVSLPLSNGDQVIAILPAGKEDSHSLALTDKNRLCKISAKRINNVGIARYVTDLGFTEAAKDDPQAVRLLDLADVHNSSRFLLEQSVNEAHRLQEELAGQRCLAVPLEGNASIRTILVAKPAGISSTRYQLGGLASGALQGVFEPDDDRSLMDAAMSDYWVVPEGTDVSTLPRWSEFGGVVQKAALILSSCGLGTIIHSSTMADDEQSAGNATSRLNVTMQMHSNPADQVIVEVDGVDELHVCYTRAGEVIYQRSGLEGLSVEMAVGSIAAVIVRVNELDHNKGIKKAA